MKEAIKILAVISLIGSLCACTSKTVYSEFRSVPLREWYADSVLTYRFDITDTTATYQIQICVRHTQQYPYQNMWLFVNNQPANESLHTALDSAKMALDSTELAKPTVQDTIEFYLANDRGVWLGNGKNGLTEMPVLYEEAYRFAHSGEQVITIQQGMREEPLRGVSDVGVIVTKNE